jgi:hypothetical protein
MTQTVSHNGAVLSMALAVLRRYSEAETKATRREGFDMAATTGSRFVKAALFIAPAMALFAAAPGAPPAAAQERLDRELQEKVNVAIDKGVAYLQKFTLDPRRDATYELGRKALVAWTLLECGVPAKDELIQRYAELIRDGVLIEDLSSANYGLSTALIFLDKLGDPSDEPLIESITARLLSAQTATGGWGYTAPPLKAAERDRLRNLLKERRELLAAGQELKDKKRTPEEALKDMQRYVRQALDFPPGYSTGSDDNSNTQFTMMALWVARRHDLPVNSALALAGKRFRVSQQSHGAWSYNHPVVQNGQLMPNIAMDNYVHPAMTCVGLIGLALEKGVQRKTKELRADKQVQRGFDWIGKHLDRLAAASAEGKAAPPGQNAGDPAAPPQRAPGAVGAPAGAPAQLSPLPGGRTDNYYYFLFSVERAAVLYDIEKIGKTDWYAWGARELVAKQSPDGGWHGHYSIWNADTCFALLFLKRANVAHDLTDLVKGIDRRPKVDRRPDPLLDLPLIIPKAEKPEKKGSPK